MSSKRDWYTPKSDNEAEIKRMPHELVWSRSRMENRTKSILGDFDAGPRGITDRARLRKSFTSLPTEANPFWLWIPQIRLLSASSISWVTYMRVLHGQTAQPRHQGGKPWSIFLPHRRKLHSHSATRSQVSHGGVGAHQAFLYEEVEINNSFHGFASRCLEEQTPHTHIEDGRNVIPSAAAPVSPNLMRGLNTRIESSRWERPHLPRIRHAPPVLSS